MCTVSHEELNKKDGPRVFLLQKLVEVADLNMNRARIEFSNMWKELKEHISSVGSHYNERIAEYAVDSLRQLARKFLEKEELNNYHFQKDFLEPFQIIMLSNMPNRMNLIHFIMSCMCSFAQQMTSNIKSGWEIIIEIFKLGGENESFDLSQEAINTLNKILQEDKFVYVEEYFEKIVNCLVRFMNSRFEPHALQALELIRTVSGYLGKDKDLINKIIDKSREVFATKDEKLLYKKRLWKCILYELSKKAFEEKTKVSETAHQLMFEILTLYNDKMNNSLWKLIFTDLLKAMFDDLHIKLESKSTTEKMNENYLINAQTVISNLINLVESMEQDKFVISVEILLQIFKNFWVSYQNSPVSTEMLRGLQFLVKTCEGRFDQHLCKKFVDVLCELFDIKEDKSLFTSEEDAKHIESSCPPSMRLSTLYEIQGHKLLGLIKNTQEISGKYDVLDNEDIDRLLNKLEFVYDIVHKFNLNIKKRFELYNTVNLRALYDRVPTLLKHETEVLQVYFTFLNKLYNDPKEDVDRPEVIVKMMSFSLKVLKSFANNYDKMLHLIKLPKSQLDEEYGSLDIMEVGEEMKRILVSISITISESVLRTILHMKKSDLKEHAKALTPLLIDCTV